MLTFRYFPGCENLVVDHINRNKAANWIDVPVLDPVTGKYELKSNLRWATLAENYANSDLPDRLTEETVRKVCELLEQGYPASSVSRMLGLKYNAVANIRNGITWKKVSKEYNIPEVPTISGRQRKVSEEQVKTICELLEKKVPVPEILKITGLPYTKRHFVYSIKKRECYSDISKDYNF